MIFRGRDLLRAYFAASVLLAFGGACFIAGYWSAVATAIGFVKAWAT
jgi:hypothetical protein